jgi:hypothetical protein
MKRRPGNKSRRRCRKFLGKKRSVTARVRKTRFLSHLWNKKRATNVIKRETNKKRRFGRNDRWLVSKWKIIFGTREFLSLLCEAKEKNSQLPEKRIGLVMASYLSMLSATNTYVDEYVTTACNTQQNLRSYVQGKKWAPWRLKFES